MQNARGGESESAKYMIVLPVCHSRQAAEKLRVLGHARRLRGWADVGMPAGCPASRAASGLWAIAIGVAAAAQSSGYRCLLEALLLPVRTYGVS